MNLDIIKNPKLKEYVRNAQTSLETLKQEVINTDILGAEKLANRLSSNPTLGLEIQARIAISLSKKNNYFEMVEMESEFANFNIDVVLRDKKTEKSVYIEIKYHIGDKAHHILSNPSVPGEDQKAIFSKTGELIQTENGGVNMKYGIKEDQKYIRDGLEKIPDNGILMVYAGSNWHPFRMSTKDWYHLIPHAKCVILLIDENGSTKTFAQAIYGRTTVFKNDGTGKNMPERVIELLGRELVSADSGSLVNSVDGFFATFL